MTTSPAQLFSFPVPERLPATAALADVLQLHGRNGWLTPPLRPFQRGPAAPALGAARTIRMAPGPGSHGLGPLRALLGENLAGQVLVIAGADCVPGAVWGEILTTAALARGAVGALVEGSVRDVTALENLSLRIWASAEATAGPSTEIHVAEIGGQVEISGVSVADGDPVLLDDGGVVVLRPESAAGLLADAADYHQAEEQVLEALVSGLRLPLAYAPKAQVVTRLRGRKA
ncbi:RraA family protein [Streptomyces albipurpureus]|uniref:Putative 4-hydroxy-4-methyl-2-oxoglutarate aldolase n=1 Tax=Streptomyces albipurpureus TaxID=2897419 RepID=A0ABT0UIU7_9ACTN|nr:RraA family protein [Streptomyces sp. CWNU-1]MCM2388557.1 RraA family protein [Streptomyces sp. CWNU-1]